MDITMLPSRFVKRHLKAWISDMRESAGLLFECRIAAVNQENATQGTVGAERAS